MSERPIAFLWQNAPILGDGCFRFYPTAERADATISLAGGWKTPVFSRAEQVEHGAVSEKQSQFLDLYDWRAGRSSSSAGAASSGCR